MPNSDDLLSVAEAAALLGVSPRQVRRRALAGTLPGRKLGAGTASYVFRRRDVERVKREQAAQAAS